MAPVNPYVVDVAASVEYDDGAIVVRRGDRFAQTAAAPLVEIAPLLRTLGVTVEYDAQSRRLLIQTPRIVYAAPTPFNRAVPRAPVRAVFTPIPQPTPRPIVSGSPSPRRTPVPINAPLSQPSPSRPGLRS